MAGESVDIVGAHGEGAGGDAGHGDGGGRLREEESREMQRLRVWRRKYHDEELQAAEPKSVWFILRHLIVPCTCVQLRRSAFWSS